LQAFIDIAERGLVPDAVVRAGIRALLRQRLRQARAAPADAKQTLMREMSDSVIAENAADANEQHYEVPTAFFRLMLGPRLKYSACNWSSPNQSLGEAEEEMLRLTSARAGIEDGMKILDLGCGWGSLALWLGAHYPRCRVLAVSNSAEQRMHIEAETKRLQLSNVQAQTTDMNSFAPAYKFDRVVSVEMFEHMRNHKALLARLARWLEDEGQLFIHIFCHREYAYFFETDGDNDWMARHFFTGGMMPSVDLIPAVADDLSLARQWDVNGRHYQRTLHAWLARLDRNRSEAVQILRQTYGAQAKRQLFRWRLFLLACAELFGFNAGREWYVSHYLFHRKAQRDNVGPHKAPH
jgi:cyclopropane-fatty-acyl-phospholipid synthase